MSFHMATFMVQEVISINHTQEIYTFLYGLLKFQGAIFLGQVYIRFFK
jgi:hypothetical protein